MRVDITLWHRREPTFEPVGGVVDLLQYAVVGRTWVDGDECDGFDEILEQVFMDSQNVERPWGRNAIWNLAGSLVCEPARSTSVGDLINLCVCGAGMLYEVKPCGFGIVRPKAAAVLAHA